MQERIRAARQETGLTQAQLARRLGVDQSLISRIESGQRPLTVDFLKELAGTLELDPAELVRAPATGERRPS